MTFLMDTYKYPPLPTPHHIRILILHPALDHNAPLSCSLNPMDLESIEPYNALSYVWGSTEEMSSLLHGGKTIRMTHNCESALRHLRHTDKDVVLWVDAICIDQSNLEERAQQVMIMGKIYQEAKIVVIWLGVGNKQIEQGFIRATLALEKDPNFEPSYDTCSEITNDISISDCLYVCDNQWSSRTWTVQEFSYATHLMVQCGKLMTSWESYKIFAGAAMMYLLIIDGQRLAEAHRGSLQLETRDNFKKSMSNIDETKIDVILALAAEVSQQNDCSDDRDRLYGLYYVLKSKLRDIPPVDYLKRTEKVYSDFVWATIKSTGRFWPALLKRPTLDLVLKAPSWMPDFKYRYRDIDLNSFNTRHIQIEISATSHSQMDLESMETFAPMKLVVKGISVASISRTTGVYGCTKSARDVLSVGRTYLEEWLHTFGIFQNESTREELLSDLLKVIELSITSEWRKNAMQYKIMEWIEFLNSKNDRLTEPYLSLKDIMFKFWQIGEESKLFITDQTRLGRAFGPAQDGDSVVLIAGSDLPLVLRHHGDSWLYVCPAYVAGIMNGEAWPQDMNVSEMETFVLV